MGSMARECMRPPDIRWPHLGAVAGIRKQAKLSNPPSDAQVEDESPFDGRSTAVASLARRKGR